ncbi:hypothetical protein Goshw_005527 [Gossypium schwendimanii]|uniref:DUF668 domain-containing protein n=1 Tax=Gossypium schwendimanii TaxID=34291 RepID=A0A7J9LTW2_GOSSC|nr:hypothetical protein [Gossypium schwendimanii]
MALETWLIKVKRTISKHPNHKSNVGILSFEIASLMTKLLHLWNSLSDKAIIRLRNESIPSEGVTKLVSNNELFLLKLACAELVENIKLVAKSISRLSSRCQDAKLRCFDQCFDSFTDSGHDFHLWALSSNDMEAKNKKMATLIDITATLYKEMEELSIMENNLRKCNCFSMKDQQRLYCQSQEVKHLKQKSLWNTTFDNVVSILVRSVFTILARLKLVFGLGFFKSNSDFLKPPLDTLGASALALHYANLIITLEKMIRSPHLIGLDTRDELYSILPSTIRSSLRGRLKGILGFIADDPLLAVEWKSAMGKILSWLSPLAHNMIKWQNERSFEHWDFNLLPKTNVLLLETLFFANKEKAEAAITELLVGLNYIWRFEREMTARALFECSKIV